MENILSFLGAFLLLLLAGSAFISAVSGVILVALVGLNERLKSIGGQVPASQN